MQEAMELYQTHCKYLLKNGLAYEELDNYDNFRELFSKKEFSQVMNIKNNRRAKRNRTKAKFKDIFEVSQMVKENKSLVFGTITLDDKHLNQAEDTYIRKIHKWLKKHFLVAILNKDFGTKTEREHYHFIGLTTEEIEQIKKKSKKGYNIYELVNKDYDMGFEPTLCLIDLKMNNFNQTTNYLLKLNNHSNKITTKNRIRVVKSEQYRYLAMLTGFEATKAEKTYKKRKLESI